MSARISLMYKRSGGCRTGHRCGECRYYLKSSVETGTYICKKHGEEGTLWEKSWYACKWYKNPIKKRQPKLKEESTGQLKMVLN